MQSRLPRRDSSLIYKPVYVTLLALLYISYEVEGMWFVNLLLWVGVDKPEDTKVLLLLCVRLK